MVIPKRMKEVVIVDESKLIINAANNINIIQFSLLAYLTVTVP